jgi:hypothetical protein
MAVALFILRRHSDPLAAAVIGAVVVAVVVGSNLCLLPPWRDPKYSPRAGAFAAAGTGLVIAAVALAIGLLAGMS